MITKHGENATDIVHHSSQSPYTRKYRELTPEYVITRALLGCVYFQYSIRVRGNFAASFCERDETN